MSFSDSDVSEAWRWLDREREKIEEHPRWEEILENHCRDSGVETQDVMVFLAFFWARDVCGYEHLRDHYREFVDFMFGMDEDELVLRVTLREEVFLRSSWRVLGSLDPDRMDRSILSRARREEDQKRQEQARRCSETQQRRCLDGRKRLSEWTQMMHETSGGAFQNWPPGVPGLRWKSVPDEPMEED